jgi:hypothetical protein
LPIGNDPDRTRFQSYRTTGMYCDSSIPRACNAEMRFDQFVANDPALEVDDPSLPAKIPPGAETLEPRTHGVPGDAAVGSDRNEESGI